MVGAKKFQVGHEKKIRSGVAVRSFLINTSSVANVGYNPLTGLDGFGGTNRNLLRYYRGPLRPFFARPRNSQHGWAGDLDRQSGYENDGKRRAGFNRPRARFSVGFRPVETGPTGLRGSATPRSNRCAFGSGRVTPAPRVRRSLGNASTEMPSPVCRRDWLSHRDRS